MIAAAEETVNVGDIVDEEMANTSLVRIYSLSPSSLSPPSLSFSLSLFLCNMLSSSCTGH